MFERQRNPQVTSKVKSMKLMLARAPESEPRVISWTATNQGLTDDWIMKESAERYRRAPSSLQRQPQEAEDNRPLVRKSPWKIDCFLEDQFYEAGFLENNRNENQRQNNSFWRSNNEVFMAVNLMCQNNEEL